MTEEREGAGERGISIKGGRAEEWERREGERASELGRESERARERERVCICVIMEVQCIWRRERER